MISFTKKEQVKEEGSRPKKGVVPEHLKNKEIAWKYLETNSREKTNDWYFILWTIAIAGAVIAVILENVLFGILIIISAFIITIYGAQKPRMISFHVSRKGVVADTLLLPFSSLSLFAISEDSEPIYLLLQSKKTLSPLYSFPISEEVDLDSLREFLLAYIDEGEMEVPAYQQLMDKVGF